MEINQNSFAATMLCAFGNKGTQIDTTYGDWHFFCEVTHYIDVTNWYSVCNVKMGFDRDGIEIWRYENETRIDMKELDRLKEKPTEQIIAEQSEMFKRAQERSGREMDAAWASRYTTTGETLVRTIKKIGMGRILIVKPCTVIAVDTSGPEYFDDFTRNEERDRNLRIVVKKVREAMLLTYTTLGKTNYLDFADRAWEWRVPSTQIMRAGDVRGRSRLDRTYVRVTMTGLLRINNIINRDMVKDYTWIDEHLVLDPETTIVYEYQDRL